MDFYAVDKGCKIYSQLQPQQLYQSTDVDRPRLLIPKGLALLAPHSRSLIMLYWRLCVLLG